MYVPANRRQVIAAYRDELVTHVVRAVDGMSSAEAVEFLWNRGLLDRRGVEAEVAREEMERLTREGMPRCRAMEEIAERLCCSYEKIRGFIYSK